MNLIEYIEFHASWYGIFGSKFNTIKANYKHMFCGLKIHLWLKEKMHIPCAHDLDRVVNQENSLALANVKAIYKFLTVPWTTFHLEFPLYGCIHLQTLLNQCSRMFLRRESFVSRSTSRGFSVLSVSCSDLLKQNDNKSVAWNRKMLLIQKTAYRYVGSKHSG